MWKHPKVTTHLCFLYITYRGLAILCACPPSRKWTNHAPRRLVHLSQVNIPSIPTSCTTFLGWTLDSPMLIRMLIKNQVIWDLWNLKGSLAGPLGEQRVFQWEGGHVKPFLEIRNMNYPVNHEVSQQFFLLIFLVFSVIMARIHVFFLFLLCMKCSMRTPPNGIRVPLPYPILWTVIKYDWQEGLSFLSLECWLLQLRTSSSEYHNKKSAISRSIQSFMKQKTSDLPLISIWMKNSFLRAGERWMLRSNCNANQSVKPQRGTETKKRVTSDRSELFLFPTVLFCCLMKPISFSAASAGAPLTRALTPLMTHKVSEECVYLLQCLCSGCSTDVSPPPAAQLILLLFINIKLACCFVRLLANFCHVDPGLLWRVYTQYLWNKWPSMDIYKSNPRPHLLPSLQFKQITNEIRLFILISLMFNWCSPKPIESLRNPLGGTGNKRLEEASSMV